jgi:peptidoglycan/LPS O-acetylase OafA/YrhL
MLEVYRKKNYRQDVQGIRAVGALLIMMYHLWFHKVSGGVDVFFVVSGFFMAGILLKQIIHGGAIRPLEFWGKIILRIAPAAYTVLLVSLALGLTIVPETFWVKLVDEVIAAALHLENIYLMRSSADYLAQAEPSSAVQQFWALSIQVQFYLILPSIFAVGWFAAKRLKRLWPLAGLIAALLSVSFIYSIYSTHHEPASAYFNPLTRGWEFLSGVLLALALPYIRLNQPTAHLLSLAGLGAVLLCGVVVPEAANFPGAAALLPVAGAVALILAGANGNRGVANRWLSHPWLIAMGNIAFGIYLWHWPLYIFYRELAAVEKVGLLPGLTIMSLSVLLAALTARLFDGPRQSQSSAGLARAYAIGILFFLPAASAPGAIKLHFESLSKEVSIEPLKLPPLTEQSDATTVPYEQFLAAKRDLPASYRDNCHQDTPDPEVLVCAYATQWLPALEQIGLAHNLKILNISKSHCPLGAQKDSHASCVDWNNHVLEVLQELDPALVITNSTRAATEHQPEHVPDSYRAQWLALAEAGIPVVGIRDNPQFGMDVAHCVARNKSDTLVCSRARGASLAEQDPALAMLDDMPHFQVIDMSDYLCTRDMCTAVFENTLMYRDKEHLTVAYVKRLTWELRDKLSAVVPEIFPQG